VNSLQNRRYIILGLISFLFLSFIARLFYLQLVDEKGKNRADELITNTITLPPSRGEIYDRENRVIAENKLIYDIQVVPEQLENLDSLAFIEMLGDYSAGVLEKIEEVSKKVKWRPYTVVKNISQDDYLRIAEQINQFSGVYGVRRTIRSYPFKSGAHVLGDFSETSPVDLEKDTTGFYKLGDYIGKSGVERAYEDYLRGKKGYQAIYVNNVNRTIGEATSENNLSPVPGTDITTTIDADLQAYGEYLMQNKRGLIIALEPSSGEILCMVSAPSFNPNSLVGKNRADSYDLLAADTLNKPLWNRAVQDYYRPGSIFKMVQALIALEASVIYPSTRISCNRSLIGCHGGHSYDDLENAIKHSCNPYFREVMRRSVLQGKNDTTFQDLRLGLTWWKKRMQDFNLGIGFNSDVPKLKKGFIPDVAMYDRYYPNAKWTYSMISSISIGEGENGVTPFQMANLAAIIANKGWYKTPHIIKRINDGSPIPEEFTKPKTVGVKKEHFDLVQRAMYRVVNESGGTAGRASLNNVGIRVCGKTGTVENKEPIKDHSVFMSFAPQENPKIAIVVYVENAGFGGTWAAPISALMIEKYLHGEATNEWSENRIINANFLKKVGESESD